MLCRLRKRGDAPVQAQAKKTDAAQPAAPAAAAKKPQSRLSYKDQRELDGMEAAIDAAEQKKASLEAQLADPAVFAKASEVAKISGELQKASAAIERLYGRWQELQSLVGA